MQYRGRVCMLEESMVASISCLACPCNYCCNSVHDATVKVGAACITTVPCSVGRAVGSGLTSTYLYIPYLSRYTNQQQPLLFHVRAVVDDLTAGEARVSVKHLQWLWISYKTTQHTEYRQQELRVPITSVTTCANLRSAFCSPWWSCRTIRRQQFATYKLCILMHLVLTGSSPSYLSGLVTSTANIPFRKWLRSADTNRYEPLTTRLKVGKRCFSHARPKAWNALSTELQNLTDHSAFRRKLITFLFDRVFTTQCQSGRWSLTCKWWTDCICTGLWQTGILSGWSHYMV